MVRELVLDTGEERFRELVRELARRAQYHIRRDRLRFSVIILGSIRPGERKYGAIVEAPLCGQRYGDGQGIFYVNVDQYLMNYFRFMNLEFNCAADRSGKPIRGVAAYILLNGWVVTDPLRLYNLYKILYKEVGTGARPLLELAGQAEANGDREAANALKKIYAILEASKDIIGEIEQGDYSNVKVGVDERELELKVDEAVELLIKAKKLAREGDITRLRDLLRHSEIVVTPRYTISLEDIILGKRLWDLIEELSAYSPKDLGEVLREADIYDAIITVAEYFGLKVERE